MKTVIYILISILIMAVQTTIVQLIGFSAVFPNIILAFIVCVALIRGSFEGGAVGFIGGIIYDLASRSVLGSNALLYIYVGVICGIFSTHIFRERYLIALSFTFLSSLVTSLIFYFFAFFIWGKGGYSALYFKNIAIEAVYTAVFSLPIFFMVKKLSARFNVNEE